MNTSTRALDEKCCQCFECQGKKSNPRTNDRNYTCQLALPLPSETYEPSHDSIRGICPDFSPTSHPTEHRFVKVQQPLEDTTLSRYTTMKTSVAFSHRETPRNAEIKIMCCCITGCDCEMGTENTPKRSKTALLALMSINERAYHAVQSIAVIYKVRVQESSESSMNEYRVAQCMPVESTHPSYPI